MRGQRLRQLVAGVDAELLVDVAQVVLDGLRAEEQRGRGFPGRLARGEQQRDLQFLRRQLLQRAGVPPPEGLAGRGELGAGPVGPGTGVEVIERVRRRAELLAGQDPVPGPPQALPVGQPRARGLERVRGLLVLAQCLLEERGEAGARVEHPLAAQGAGERPRLALGSGRGREPVGGLPRLILAPEPGVGVDELDRGREVGVGDAQVEQQLLLPLEVLGGAGGIAETQLQLAERRRGPDLAQPCPELLAEVERLGDAGPAVQLPSAAALQPGQPGQAEDQLSLLPTLPGQVDRLAVAGLSDRPAVGGGLVPGDQVEHERERADRGTVPGGSQRIVEQRPPGPGLPQEQRPQGQPGDQPKILAQVGRALGERDGLVHRGRAGRAVTAEDPGHPHGDRGQEADAHGSVRRQQGSRPLGGRQHLGRVPG